jgi:hypothetical protein
MIDWYTIAEERQRQIEYDDQQTQILRYIEIMGSSLQRRLVSLDHEIYCAALAEMFSASMAEVAPETRYRLLQLVNERAQELER